MKVIQLDLTGKTALVCGASRGIGQAICRQLAIQGARLILLSRDREELEKVRAECLSSHLHHVLPVDLSNLGQLKTSLENLLLSIENVEILICNSGGPKGGPLLEARAEDFLQAFHQHLLANHVLMQSLVPSMKKAHYGRIVTILSTSVKVPIANLGVSNTIRGAVASWSKTLASELGKWGITVNNVLPGYTSTERLRELMEQSSLRSNRATEEIKKEWEQSVPIQRFADPLEVAQTVGFLVSPAASYINGINLPVDGGRLGCL